MSSAGRAARGRADRGRLDREPDHVLRPVRPEGYKEGDAKRWLTLLFRYGSKMNARDYVATLALAWPDIARDYLILGINGEIPSDLGHRPRFNFSYVNYMGRSTYKGFPATDRESPGLIAEALDHRGRPIRSGDTSSADTPRGVG